MMDNNMEFWQARNVNVDLVRIYVSKPPASNLLSHNIRGTP